MKNPITFQNCVAILFVVVLALFLTGCQTTRENRVQYGEPIQVREVVDEDGAVGVKAGDRFYSADSIAMQTALFAQGLPVEPWYTRLLPNLFSTDPEEVRTGLMLYGIQMEAWRETIVLVEFPTVHSGDVTVEGASIRFPTSQPPEPPEFMSGLQRLGITGSQILTGFMAWMAFDLSKSVATQPNDPTIVRPEVIQVPEGG